MFNDLNKFLKNISDSDVVSIVFFNLNVSLVIDRRISEGNVLIKIFPIASSADNRIKILNNLSIKDKKNAIMLGDVTDNIHLSSRNIKGTIIFSALSASTYDLLDCQKLIFDLDGIEKLNNQLSEN